VLGKLLDDRVRLVVGGDDETVEKEGREREGREKEIEARVSV